jgi:pimeloyl-ACP methyl ester carboxylesterase
MSAITIGGDLVHYEVLGRGRQVVLVHGWLGSWRYWVPTMQQLQSRYRLYALDLYGFGDSGRNPQKYDLEHQIDLMVDFMNRLGLPKAAIIGHGLGALLSAEFARRYPERVPRLMLVSAPLFDPGDLDRRVPAGRKVLLTNNRAAPEPQREANPDAPTIMSPSAAMRAALVEAARASRHSSVGSLPANPPDMTDVTMDRAEVLPLSNYNPMKELVNDLDTMLGRCFRRSEPEYEKLLADIEKTDRRVVPQAMSTFDAGRMLDTLRLLPMPTVVIHGLDDPLIKAPIDAVWHYVTMDKENLLLPIQLPGVRHFPMLENERFFRLTLDFLEADDLSRLEIRERWVRRTR